MLCKSLLLAACESAIVVALLLICIIGLSGATLMIWGRGFGDRFLQRVGSLATMQDINRAVGAPNRVSTNYAGMVMWDYTRWWSATAKVYFDTNGIVYRVF